MKKNSRLLFFICFISNLTFAQISKDSTSILDLDNYFAIDLSKTVWYWKTTPQIALNNGKILWK